MGRHPGLFGYYPRAAQFGPPSREALRKAELHFQHLVLSEGIGIYPARFKGLRDEGGSEI